MPMNVLQLSQRLQDEVPGMGPREARKRIARAIHANQGAHNWTFLMKRTSIQTEALYNTGTVAATNGSTSVVLTGGTWQASWSTAPSTRRIVIQGRPEPYDITITSSTAGTLAEPFLGTTNTAAKYTLFRDVYPLPADCDYGKLLVLWDVDLNRKMSFLDALKFQKRKFLANGTTGTPMEFSYIGFTSETTPRPQIEFGFDAPSSVNSYRLWYFIRPAFAASDTEIPLFPEPYEDLHWLRAAIDYGSSARTPQKNLPMWVQRYDALFSKAKAEMDGGAEIDREIETVYLGRPFGGAGVSAPDFQNNWRFSG